MSAGPLNATDNDENDGRVIEVVALTGCRNDWEKSEKAKVLIGDQRYHVANNAFTVGNQMANFPDILQTKEGMEVQLTPPPSIESCSWDGPQEVIVALTFPQATKQSLIGHISKQKDSPTSPVSIGDISSFPLQNPGVDNGIISPYVAFQNDEVDDGQSKTQNFSRVLRNEKLARNVVGDVYLIGRSPLTDEFATSKRKHCRDPLHSDTDSLSYSTTVTWDNLKHESRRDDSDSLSYSTNSDCEHLLEDFRFMFEDGSFDVKLR